MRSPELALELRTTRPAASPELRERVLSVAARAESPRRRRMALPPLRRLALVAAVATAVVAVSGALVYGLAESGGPGRRGPTALERAGENDRLPAHVTRSAPARGVLVDPGAKQALATPRSVAVPVTRSRLQQYGAALSVQVRDRAELSDATKRAMRVARLLGGYVAYTRYSAPTRGRGAASLVVRVPIDRVGDAVAEYSALGTILAQNVTVRDLTKAVAEQAKEIARLRAEIATLEAGGVTASERPRLAADTARLDYLTKRRRATVRRAQLARVVLELTTKPKAAAAPASRFHRTIAGAGGVLVREFELLLYAFVVAGPLLLLGGALIGAGRMRDRRLFERS
jgi:hypothetical protein